MIFKSLIALLICASVAAAQQKVSGVYTSILSFTSQEAMDAAVKAQPSFLKDKHKKAMATSSAKSNVELAQKCGFNALFMTIYPLWGTDWWNIAEARGLVKDAATRGHEQFKVHLGLSLFNAQFCERPEKYPGASRTIQCDGTRPTWVCFFSDALWDTYIKNMTELAKVAREVGCEGVFVDPEAYGPEEYLCFCDECVGKFDKWSGQEMPKGLVKPDAWLHAHHQWERYTKDWHDQEVKRHAVALREAIHAVNARLQLSSCLWDYPVAVGVGDPRQQYFRMLAIGLGTKEKPSWVMPEHTYYSDGPDLKRIIGQVYSDIDAMGATGQVEVLPGIRLLRRSADSLRERGDVIQKSRVPGYWMYELTDLAGKQVIDFEGSLVDPEQKYVQVLGEMNSKLSK